MLLNSPEQEHKAVALHGHADDWPAEQHQGHASQEEGGASELLSLEEEAGRPPQANDERQTSQKQNLKERRTRQALFENVENTFFLFVQLILSLSLLLPVTVTIVKQPNCR